ncbi:MAG: hypothetical protein EXR72_23975 [Myxococcales bacterium]|nr:hypothetical protein [Myxococcales bacterium]
MGGEIIEVFCDGSVTNAVMVDPFTSHLGNQYVGRAMVAIPALDFGLMAQTRDGVVTERGTPASTEVEAFAIRTALKVCAALGLASYIVFSDCQGPVEAAGNDRVKWRSREQMYLPNSFFDRVLGRAGYLRKTSQTVGKRRPAEPHPIEAYELFQAERREFKLSASALWARVAKDARRHERALGVSPGKVRSRGPSPPGTARSRRRGGRSRNLQRRATDRRGQLSPQARRGAAARGARTGT